MKTRTFGARLGAVLLASALAPMASTVARADAVSDFYKGKSVTIIYTTKKKETGEALQAIL